MRFKLIIYQVLYGLWRVVYWSSQFLTWLLLPMMQVNIKKAKPRGVKDRSSLARFSYVHSDTPT
jgi:hypothetical protein